jgi:hypothetical protein
VFPKIGQLFGVRRLDGAFGGIHAIWVIPDNYAKSGVEPPQLQNWIDLTLGRCPTGFYIARLWR